MATPKLQHVFDLIITSNGMLPVERSEHSSQCVANVNVGKLKPADGSAEFDVLAGTDWMTVDVAGVAIDARVSTEGPDGNLDLTYTGRLNIGPEVKAIFEGKGNETQFGEGYYYTCPRISSRSAKYAWVNSAVFLSMGKLRVDPEGNVEATYRILKIG